MTPTRISTLLAVAVAVAVLGYGAAELAYGALPQPTASAPVALVLLAIAELALAKVVRDRVQHRLDAHGRPPRRALHPVQVARAAALAKASSLTGAVVAGGYGGLTAWTVGRADVLAAAATDVPVVAAAAVAGVLLTVSALLLERACRVPDPPDEPPRLGSTS